MKQFDCHELMPGCDWHARAHSEAELIEPARRHLSAVHGREFTHPVMSLRLLERIHDCAPATRNRPRSNLEIWRERPVTLS